MTVSNGGSSHRCGRRVAVVFDLDGTLFDSELSGHRVAFNRAFAELGIDVHWCRETYRGLLRITGGRRRIEQYLIESGWSHGDAAATAVLAHRLKTDLFLELAMAGRIPPRPGIPRLLHDLVAAGAELHVATTGRASWVRPLLAGTFGPDVFDLVITGDDVLELKPAPDAYRQVVHGAGLDPGHVVVVEDSQNGLSAARAAGLTCVVVTNPYTSEGPFPGAVLMCSGFKHLDANQLLRLTPCQQWRRRRSLLTPATPRRGEVW